ncbi:hypothetical protein [Enterococcus diestrammenae]|uniref:hypothetical protein n=1 Tax=Enterococcus sp. DIV1390a TaxID=2774970 RepID=UPI00137A5F12|nr:hypothetical protein [Enterococcus diestrammenae]KAF1294790.1 hypothetical protein BAU18_03555 [Enterococcus diestrammenae]
MSRYSAKEMGKTFKNIFGWTVDGEQVIPPKFSFPDCVWDRVSYFSEGFEYGLTYSGCLSLVLAYDEDDCKKKFDLGDPRPWFPVTQEFKQWRDAHALREMEIAAVLLYT